MAISRKRKRALFDDGSRLRGVHISRPAPTRQAKRQGIKSVKLPSHAAKDNNDIDECQSLKISREENVLKKSKAADDNIFIEAQPHLNPSTTSQVVQSLPGEDSEPQASFDSYKKDGVKQNELTAGPSTSAVKSAKTNSSAKARTDHSLRRFNLGTTLNQWAVEYRAKSYYDQVRTKLLTMSQDSWTKQKLTHRLQTVWPQFCKNLDDTDSQIFRGTDQKRLDHILLLIQSVHNVIMLLRHKHHVSYAELYLLRLPLSSINRFSNVLGKTAATSVKRIMARLRVEYIQESLTAPDRSHEAERDALAAQEKRAIARKEVEKQRQVKLRRQFDLEQKAENEAALKAEQERQAAGIFTIRDAYHVRLATEETLRQEALALKKAQIEEKCRSEKESTPGTHQKGEVEDVESTRKLRDSATEQLKTAIKQGKSMKDLPTDWRATDFIVQLTDGWRMNGELLAAVELKNLSNRDGLIYFGTYTMSPAQNAMLALKLQGSNPEKLLSTGWDLAIIDRLWEMLDPHHHGNKHGEEHKWLREKVASVCECLREAKRKVKEAEEWKGYATMRASTLSTSSCGSFSSNASEATGITTSGNSSWSGWDTELMEGIERSPATNSSKPSLLSRMTFPSSGATVSTSAILSQPKPSPREQTNIVRRFQPSMSSLQQPAATPNSIHSISRTTFDMEKDVGIPTYPTIQHQQPQYESKSNSSETLCRWDNNPGDCHNYEQGRYSFKHISTLPQSQSGFDDLKQARSLKSSFLHTSKSPKYRPRHFKSPSSRVNVGINLSKVLHGRVGKPRSPCTPTVPKMVMIWAIQSGYFSTNTERSIPSVQADKGFPSKTKSTHHFKGRRRNTLASRSILKPTHSNTRIAHDRTPLPRTTVTFNGVNRRERLRALIQQKRLSHGKFHRRLDSILDPDIFF